MIKIIAVLCGLSSPANCHEQTVTTSDFADVSMQSCLMGATQLAEWMNLHPAERPAGWRCVISLTCGGRKNCSSGAAAREVLPVSSESSPQVQQPSCRERSALASAQTKSGLPIRLQIVGRFRDEANAGPYRTHLKEARPWATSGQVLEQEGSETVDCGYPGLARRLIDTGLDTRHAAHPGLRHDLLLGLSLPWVAGLYRRDPI
ncbi:hypothetical protein ABIC03_005403 [Bradyrhizobium sp. RT6a]